jgi:hypothetical protein
MVTLANRGDLGVAASALCDHDGRASGRLTLADGGIRAEIVCECGRVLAFLGCEDYNLAAGTAPHGQPTSARWRRSTAQAARAFRRSVGRRGLHRRR